MINSKQVNEQQLYSVLTNSIKEKETDEKLKVYIETYINKSEVKIEKYDYNRKVKYNSNVYYVQTAKIFYKWT